MSESSNQQQQQSHYKTITSESDTRNPTTNKKYYISPTQFQRSTHMHPSHSLQHNRNSVRNRAYSLTQSISKLKQEKIKQIEAGRYLKAEALDGQIMQSQSMLQKYRIQQLQKQRLVEKRLIKEAYHEQIAHFQRAWNNYFELVRQNEIQIFKIFKKQRQLQAAQIKQNLRKKYTSLRHINRQMIDLERKQNYYISKQNYRELSVIKKQKKRAQQKSVSQRQSMIRKLTEIQQSKLSKNQNRRYEGLMQKIRQNRVDQQKLYINERKRLKQKYKNVLSQLKHQQKMSNFFAISWACPK